METSIVLLAASALSLLAPGEQVYAADDFAAFPWRVSVTLVRGGSGFGNDQRFKVLGRCADSKNSSRINTFNEEVGGTELGSAITTFRNRCTLR